MEALSFFLKRKDTEHQKSKTDGLTLNFNYFECLNESNVTFRMSHANFIGFNMGSQCNVKWNFLVLERLVIAGSGRFQIHI